MSLVGPATAVLGTFSLLYSCALALGALSCAVRGHGPGTGCVGGAALLELMLVARALLDGWALAEGAQVAEPTVHAGYLATSVVLLPLLFAVTRNPEDPSGAASASALDAAILAVGCAALVVVELRLGVTGRLR